MFQMTKIKIQIKEGSPKLGRLYKHLDPDFHLHPLYAATMVN